MTVLHATEAASVYLSLPRPGRRAERRRRRPGAVRRPQPGQAAGDAAHPLRLPARPAARRLGERLGPGRASARAPGSPRRSSRAGSPPTVRPGSTPPGAAALARLADGSAALRPAAARAGARARRHGSTPRRQQVGRPTCRSRRGCSPSSASRGGSSAAATPGTGGPRARSGPRCRPGSARCRTRSHRARGVRRARPAAGCAPSGRAPRPTSVVAGRAPRERSAQRWPTSARSRSGSTAVAPAGCCPTTSPTASTTRGVEPWAALLPVLDPTVMGWKERGFYLGRARSDAVRHQRQRRHHGLVGRPDRRVLGPGPRRRRPRSTCWRTSVPTAGRALAVEADRLTDWLDGPAGEHGLPVDGDEVGGRPP